MNWINKFKEINKQYNFVYEFDDFDGNLIYHGKCKGCGYDDVDTSFYDNVTCVILNFLLCTDCDPCIEPLPKNY